ncbi:hypothetical protein [Streptomyces acidiscabies]|uniref:Uncharacterized protein n=1 Tax=Streptomyces acidiscabies TaxID=42234 RepID=A0AAP6BC89_9ACTN|nr:hypothetical protein [Streptomyces acidiscabies]MBP5942407.1 hypothetical protein [Streptomyces sp. LBUM 1476]MBZ3917851.1 hypothetical protein [Streptomyces acidiscabies]MDX2961822.1 hypothetical protein [Streptomyces acidiscabies]MDX3023431.1 hypothetical protein [Streptomyces acidiscabies]MDX3789363.1 hypothetical protein [Streptomyces acidiscabies]
MVRKREADSDGVPPSHLRLASPYDPDARWSAKGDELFWLGCKVHLTETCDTDSTDSTDSTGTDGNTGGAVDAGPTAGGAPNLITDVATTVSTAPDVTATVGIQRRLTEHQVKPGEHYLDSG